MLKDVLFIPTVRSTFLIPCKEAHMRQWLAVTVQDSSIDLDQGWYFHIGRSEGGLDLASSLSANFGVRSPNKMKNLGSSGTTRGKNWDIISGKRIAYYLFRCYFKWYKGIHGP